MKKVLFALAVLVPVLAWAGSLSFQKKMNMRKFQSELGTATGLKYWDEVDCSTCVQAGWFSYSEVGSQYDLTVGVYENLNPSNPRLSSATWTTDLQNAITDTVNAHVP